MTAITPIWMREHPDVGEVSAPMPRRVDTVVIGAGLTGLSAAYHILKTFPGRQVIVLEADRIGAGASGRNTGMLTPGVGQNLAALVRRFGAESARGLYEVSLDAVRYVGRLTAEEGIDCDLQMNGQLILARGSAGPARLGRQARLLEKLGLPHEVLGAQKLNQTLRLPSTPRASTSAHRALAVRLPIAGTLHPGQLLLGLANRVRELGGELYERSPVRSIGRDKPVSLQLAAGTKVQADNVVLATSAFTPDLRVFRGRLLPVHLRVLLTEPLDASSMTRIGWEGRECVTDSRRIFNFFRLTASNEIAFGGGIPRYRWGGATEEDASANADVRRLAAELTRTLGADLDIRIAGHWQGVIGYSADALPVVHRLRINSSVLYAGAWCGHGIALSVYSGTWLAEILAGRKTTDLPWFRDRPPRVPTELVRWVGFNGASRWMKVLDGVPRLSAPGFWKFARTRGTGRPTAATADLCDSKERSQ